jgi:hypothetical protein
LNGTGAATGGEAASERVWALKEFVRRFGTILNREDVEGLQEARKSYARSNGIIGFGEIE